MTTEIKSLRVPCTWKIILIAILVLVGAELEWRIRKSPVDFDEPAWIMSSLYFADLVAAGDFTSAAWEPDFFGAFGSINPHLGQAWLALAIRLTPSTRHLHFTRADTEKLALASMQAAPNSVPTVAITVARRAHAAIGLSCLVLVYWLALQVSSPLGATLTTLATGTSIPFLQIMPKAMTDGPYDAALLLLALLLLKWTEAASSPGKHWLPPTIGGVIGVAFNVKATGLVLGLALVAAITVFLLYRHPTNFHRLLRQSCIAGAVALFCSILFNPYLWPTAKPPADGGRYNVLLPARLAGSTVDRGTVIGRAPVWLRLPELHLRWNRQLKAQAAYFSAHDHETLPRRVILQHLFFDYNFRLVGLTALVLCGVAVLHYWSRYQFHPDASRCWIVRISPRSIGLALIATVHVTWLVVLLPLDWSRYYLPALLMVFLVEAWTIDYLCRTLTRGTRLVDASFVRPR